MNNNWYIPIFIDSTASIPNTTSTDSSLRSTTTTASDIGKNLSMCRGQWTSCSLVLLHAFGTVVVEYVCKSWAKRILRMLIWWSNPFLWKWTVKGLFRCSFPFTTNQYVCVTLPCWKHMLYHQTIQKRGITCSVIELLWKFWKQIQKFFWHNLLFGRMRWSRILLN